MCVHTLPVPVNSTSNSTSSSRDCQSDESWVMTQSWLLRVLTIWAQITVTGSFDQEYCEHRLFVGCLMQIDPRTAVLWRRTCDQEMSGNFQSHFWEMSWEFPQSLLRNESKSNMGLIERKSVNSFNDSAVSDDRSKGVPSHEKVMTRSWLMADFTLSDNH